MTKIFPIGHKFHVVVSEKKMQQQKTIKQKNVVTEVS